jgi:metal-responsive CopG/Arc/MetJ family transcriptional regulator
MSTPIRRKTRVLNISVPPEMYEEIEELASAENRTKSELIREAFRSYQFTRRWRLIRQLGEETTVRMNLQTDEALEDFLG